MNLEYLCLRLISFREEGGGAARARNINTLCCAPSTVSDRHQAERDIPPPRRNKRLLHAGAWQGGAVGPGSVPGELQIRHRRRGICSSPGTTNSSPAVTRKMPTELHMS